MNQTVVKIENLVKRYKDVLALDHFNLEIEEGEVFGLLGPNGSGKTTTINCLLSLLTYDKGIIEIFGKPMRPDSYSLKRDIGVVMQNVAVFEELTVYENIDYFCGLYIKDKTERRKLVEEAIDLATLVCGTGISIVFFVLSYFTSKGTLLSKAGLLYMGNAYVLMIVAIAITYLFSQLTANENVLNMVANIFGLGSCFLCGVFVPLEYLSPKVTVFSKFLPPYWYVMCMEKIAGYNGASGQLQAIIVDYGILLLFAIAIFAVALLVSKTKNEQS